MNLVVCLPRPLRKVTMTAKLVRWSHSHVTETVLLPFPIVGDFVAKEC